MYRGMPLHTTPLQSDAVLTFLLFPCHSSDSLVVTLLTPNCHSSDSDSSVVTLLTLSCRLWPKPHCMRMKSKRKSSNRLTLTWPKGLPNALTRGVSQVDTSNSLSPSALSE
eukprot:5326007-Amphidinium_carterae.1